MLSLQEIITATGGHCENMQELIFTGITTDSRIESSGELFVALCGERFDGHAYCKMALEHGAAAVLVSKPVPELPSETVIITVEDTLLAYQQIAHAYRMSNKNLKVVAVTGSNGKTSTKDMIAACLSTKFKVIKTQENFNNEIGLSLTLLSMTPETEACVVEMGMRGLGQIAGLCRIAAPTIGVVTNVGTSHIGILGSQENIAKAKGELIESLPDKGIAILNEDDPYVIKMGDTFSGNIIGYGVNGNYTVHGSRIQYENNCTKYVCTCFDEAFKVKLNMLGIHNVYNALAATATARVLGIDVNRIQKALSEFLPGAQRQFFTEINGVTVIDDSYNANPLSMEMAFHAMRQVNGKHYFLVLGDMGELGEKEEQFHYELGKIAANIGFDGMITVGKLSRHIAMGARDAGKTNIMECTTCEDAWQRLQKMIQSGDVVLVKGSRYMHMETILELWRKSLN